MISDYVQKLQQSYLWWGNIDFGTEWICNPARYGFLPKHQGGLLLEDQRHERWLNFLDDYPKQLLAGGLLKNRYDLDKLQKKKIHAGLEFDIMMKGIDKVEHDFLHKIQQSTEMKETYDRLKLREIFELQRSKNLVDDDQSDPEMSWLPGTTFDEKFEYFVQRKKDEHFLEMLEKIPTGKKDHSSLKSLLNEQQHYYSF